MKPQNRFSKIKITKHSGKRRIRSLDNLDKQREEYPVLAEKIVDMSDIVLEVLDARFIKETRNKFIEKKIKEKNKRIIYVINKIDLIKDKNELFRKISFLIPRVLISCKNRIGISELRGKIKSLSKTIQTEKSNLKKVVVGVIGYPNTGKSSLINMVTGKNSLGVSPRAGFTKGIIKLNLTKDIVLLDSPGIIAQEKYSNTDSSLMIEHAKIGARDYSDVKNPELFVYELIKRYPKLIGDYYQINLNEINYDPELFLERLGKRKNLLKKGGLVNEDQVSRLIIKDWQEGKI